MDLQRADALFRLALDEQRALLARESWTFDVDQGGSRWRSAAMAAGRGMVRFGVWLQAVACRSCPPAERSAYAGAGR
jgi:hypothetical protein